MKISLIRDAFDIFWGKVLPNFIKISPLIFYKDVSALFMLSELQPCVISIRLKFAQRKQSSICPYKKLVTIYLCEIQQKIGTKIFGNHSRKILNF
jgi:hypothetical protein